MKNDTQQQLFDTLDEVLLGEIGKPKREKGREYTRDQIAKIYDNNIAANEKQWGKDYIYTKWAREAKEAKLKKYDAGEVVLVEKEGYHENGMDFERNFYSDGTMDTTCYGYTD